MRHEMRTQLSYHYYYYYQESTHCWS